MTANDDHTTEHTEPEPGDVLYDHDHGEAYAVIVGVDDAGVTMRRSGVERFVPHALFAPWNDAGLSVDCDRETDEREWDDTPERARRVRQ